MSSTERCAACVIKGEKVARIAVFHMTSSRFKLKKLSIFPSFYFHEVLEQLKTNIYTNCNFERVLRLVIEYA